LLKQNEFFDEFPMVCQTGDRHIQAVMNNIKFISLDYLAAKKSGILDWRRDFWDWFINSSSIWTAMPLPPRRYTQNNTFRDNALRTHTQHWSADWSRGVAGWYAMPVCDVIIQRRRKAKMIGMATERRRIT